MFASASSAFDPRRRSSTLALRYSHAYRDPRRIVRDGAALTMTEDHDPVAIREVALDELEPGRALHAAFIALHDEWTDRGVARWLELVRLTSPHPVVVFGAFVERGRVLVGAVIGVWASEPISRFDDLFLADKTIGRAGLRPRGGAWHLVAVTTDDRPGVRGLGLGRALLGRVLAWAADQGHARVRTLSPALGLPALRAQWPGDLIDAIGRSARGDGKPALQVLRLHLGGGAVLERILPDSRRDDRASGGVTLRFCYATDPDTRRVQRERWQAWCHARADLIAHGDASPIAPELYRVTTDVDGAIVLEAR